jgi:hypothetical protein
MMISTLKVSLVGAIALAILTPTAMASPVAITTDRVQVQVGNNGQVYIRTLADGPTVLPQVTVPQVGSSLPAATFAPACTARSHSAHSTRSTPGGTVVYSENRSTTRVCQ